MNEDLNIESNAEINYQKSIKLCPEDNNSYLNLFRLYYEQERMDKIYDLIEFYKKHNKSKNINFLNSSLCLYKKNKYDDFKFKFNELKKIEFNYSQAFQDMFVMSVLNGKGMVLIWNLDPEIIFLGIILFY